MRLLKFITIIIVIILNIYAFTTERYENISSGGEPNTFKFLEWKLTRNKPKWPDLPSSKPVIAQPIIAEEVLNNDIVVTYINHSSFLIQMGQMNILTDPIWSEYAGPFGKYGIKRTIYPGMEINQLPQIDFILISHSHYDHLDLPTIEALTKYHKPTILMGKGVARYIDYCNEDAKHCYELNWWDNVRIGDSNVIVHFVPAHHWSSRYFFDKNTSLWGGFVIQNGQDKVYFAGDTGFGDGKIFKDIKENYGNMRLSLLPIGAYKPTWFFSEMHTTPEQAVEIFSILGSQNMIPIHFDTFQLSDEGYEDPLIDLVKALNKYNIDSEKVNVMQAGESWKVP